ncbi:MAG: DUF4296 domain-containing protein, partial [Tannerella sp.]|nr:DUF4296 domain-containing protein [Tannerella sp.]
MKNKLRIVSVFIIIFLSASCSRVPKDVISEKKMRKVLYDMQVAEAMVSVEYEKYRTTEEKQKLYDAVFDKHGITQAEYDSSLIWYGKNMDLYMAVYKLVLKDIEKNIDLLGDVKQDPLSGEASTRDSLDIWIQDNSFAFAHGTSFAQLIFDIKPQVPYSQGSIYKLDLNLCGILPAMRDKPRVKLSAVQGDTVITVSREIQGDGYHETTLKTVENRQVNRIFGYVFINNTEKFHRIYLNDI